MQKRKPQPRPEPRPSRAGMVLVAGHFPAEVQTQLKIMAAEERSTVQVLLGEALDLCGAHIGGSGLEGADRLAESNEVSLAARCQCSLDPRR